MSRVDLGARRPRLRARPLPLVLLLLLLPGGALLLAACHQDMRDQPRYEPLEASTLFADGRASRYPVPGTVARGQLAPPDQPPPAPPTDDALLARGLARHTIFCEPCHGPTGHSDGRVVERGYPAPPAYLSDEVAGRSDAELYDVISNGRGRMFPYASAIVPRDRWAIVAWVRELQRRGEAP